MSATAERPLALVTGASTGIGFELAKVFAENGFDLIVAAENERIMKAGDELRRAGAQVDAVQVDLATESGVEELGRHVTQAQRPLEAAAINAGIGASGAFATDSDLSQELRLVDLNVRSTVHVAKYVLADMVKQHRGRVLFTSSIAATMPGSYAAVYNASKSFVQSFALALREELSESGVTVTSLMPGPTDTEFFERAEMEDTKIGSDDESYKDSPADVARDGFEALMNGDERVISHSARTRAQGLMSRVLPDSVKARMHGQQAEPGSARQG